MKEERIKELKKFDEQLGVLHKNKKQEIFGIAVYSAISVLCITALVLGIIFIKGFVVIFLNSMILALCLGLIVYYIRELKATNKDIKAVCKAVADLIEEDVKEMLDKLLDEIIKSIEPKPLSAETIEIREEPKAKAKRKTRKKTSNKKEIKK